MYRELREASRRRDSAVIRVNGNIPENREISHTRCSDRVAKVPSLPALESVVSNRSAKDSIVGTIINSPIHRTNGDSNLDEIGSSDDGVILDDRADVGSRERSEIDHVDSSESLSLFRDDGVAADC